MIVRISGEEQYDLPDADCDHLIELEKSVIAIVESGREDGFAAKYAELLDYVRSRGSVVADDDIASSDVILPPADLSFEEAGREFTGEGIIPEA